VEERTRKRTTNARENVRRTHEKTYEEEDGRSTEGIAIKTRDKTTEQQNTVNFCFLNESTSSWKRLATVNLTENEEEKGKKAGAGTSVPDLLLTRC